MVNTLCNEKYEKKMQNMCKNYLKNSYRYCNC